MTTLCLAELDLRELAAISVSRFRLDTPRPSKAEMRCLPSPHEGEALATFGATGSAALALAAEARGVPYGHLR